MNLSLGPAPVLCKLPSGWKKVPNPAISSFNGVFIYDMFNIRISLNIVNNQQRNAWLIFKVCRYFFFSRRIFIVHFYIA